MSFEVVFAPKYAFISGYSRIVGEWTKVIEGDFGLDFELMPEAHGEVGINGGEASYEMVFPRANGSLGFVGPVTASRDVLVFDLELNLQEVLQLG
jgi:hypothetical protein